MFKLFLSLGVAVATILGGTQPAQAGPYVTGFETLAAAPSGTILTGQDGYYRPFPTDNDFLVFTYAGNTLGLPANPGGGKNFIAGTSLGGPGNGQDAYARAQRDHVYDASTWSVSYDIATLYLGGLPATQNLGSFSPQPTSAANFVALATWTDPNTATNWNADYNYYDAAGVLVQGSVPDPAFQNLSVSKWYNWRTTFDLATNRILEVELRDLAGGTGAVYAPADWYMSGGAAGGQPTPSAFRFFGGGTTPGNTMAFDNFSLVAGTRPIPEPSTVALVALGLAGLLVARRRRA